MITIIKLDPNREEKIRYTGETLERTATSTIVSARWTLNEKDLGYTQFQRGDIFTEYYYTQRWFNIFDIAQADGQRKGWYCNITEPAHITTTTIEQIDLYLDVWVDPTGKTLLLDEDEFEAATTLTNAQRQGARQGLSCLMDLIEKRQEVFAAISNPR
ncbi:MAG TPA: DUF402 domain-containing protein [Dictyobacter sp.]|nr:DUF402 domain-containing protein [Dictyobacter sp.]